MTRSAAAVNVKALVFDTYGTNASFAGMVHLAKFARLPWDCVITAENAGDLEDLAGALGV